MVQVVANYSTALPIESAEASAEEFVKLGDFWSTASLWIPHHIVPSGWLEHGPFAFWLMQSVRPQTLVELGTYTGFSYLSFCQAVRELNLGTTCYAIDSWKGDEHSGFYADDVFHALKVYHDSRYAGFSQLVRSTFADAAERFDDRSIDLLHIDGRHFYEDVRADFETWQPKLSNRAVVLFHDTNCREGTFGVWRFWSELAQRYPTFEFKHGHGLGLLAAGDEIPSPLRSLLFASESARDRVRQVYARLGSTIVDKCEVKTTRDQIPSLQEALETQRVENTHLLAISNQIPSLQEALETQRVENARLLAISNQIPSLQEALETQRVENARLLAISNQIPSLQEALETQRVENARLLAISNQIPSLQEALETRRVENARLLVISTARARTLEALREETEARHQELEKATTYARGLEGQITALRKQREEELEKATTYARGLEGQITALRKQREEGEARHQELEKATAYARGLEGQIKALQEQLFAIQTSTSWKLTHPLRELLLNKPTLRRLARRVATITWWIITGQLFQRLRHRDHSRARSVEKSSHAKSRDTKKQLLADFMSRSDRIALNCSPSPIVSVIIITYNSPDLVFGCLSALSRNLSLPAQTIVFDNASGQETLNLLLRLAGAEIEFSTANLHFLRAVNRAARNAKGRYLVLLNSDAEISAGAIEAAIETLEQVPDAGAVGGRIVLPDGTLQEAGCILWNDGSCAGYGRGANPESYEFQYRRAVDFCSAVFLVISRELFDQLGGFDERLVPAYYEDTDLAVRLSALGKRVIYDPRALITHFEYGSSDAGRATELMRRNQAIFRELHSSYLRTKFSPDLSKALLARSSTPQSKRLLFIDDDLPICSAGAGFPRARDIVNGLLRRGFEVTHIPLQRPVDLASARKDLPLEVEVPDLRKQSLEQFLELRRGYFGQIFVSRPHNMQSVTDLRRKRPQLFHGSELIYDAEAIFARRQILQSEVLGQPLSGVDQRGLLRGELELACQAPRVTAVSMKESEEFRAAGASEVYVLAHQDKIAPTDRPFESRRDFLFVGRLDEDNSPNVDSIIWFASEVLPLIERQLGSSSCLFLVGRANAKRIQRIKSSRIQAVGEVGDLTTWYDRCRVFVAPTRFAAGIPRKVCGAAAAGIPTVATRLLFTQLGWEAYPECMGGTTAEEFAGACSLLYTNEELWHRAREAQLELVAKDFSESVFNRQLDSIFGA